MKNILKLTTAALILAASGAHGEGTTFLYEQQLEGVYSQAWSAAHLESFEGNTHEIYVKGDGKLGEFNGVLYLDCGHAQYTNWIALGEYFAPENVPPEALAAVHAKYC